MIWYAFIFPGLIVFYVLCYSLAQALRQHHSPITKAYNAHHCREFTNRIRFGQTEGEFRQTCKNISALILGKTFYNRNG